MTFVYACIFLTILLFHRVLTGARKPRAISIHSALFVIFFPYFHRTPHVQSYTRVRNGNISAL